MAAQNGSISHEEISFKTDVYYRMGFISYHEKRMHIEFIPHVIPKVIPNEQSVDFRDVEKYFIESKLDKTYLDKIQTIVDKAFKKRILIAFRSQSNFDENNTLGYLDYVLESLRYQDETSFKTECFVRMGVLSQDRTVIRRSIFLNMTDVASFNSYIKFASVDTYPYIPAVSRERLNKLFTFLDMAYEKEIYPEVWNAEKWNNDWWKYLDYVFETLNAEPENPRIKIYHDLGVVRNNTNIILGREMIGMKKPKSASEFKRLIITKSPKYMSEEIFYITKRILAGDVIYYSVEPYIKTDRWSEFISDVMMSLTGVKTFEKAKLNAYIQLGIISKIIFDKMEENRHGCDCTVRFEYQGHEHSIVRQYLGVLPKREQRRKSRQEIIDFLNKEQVNTPGVTKLVNLILTQTITNVKIIHGDFSEKIVDFYFSVQGSDNHFTIVVKDGKMNIFDDLLNKIERKIQNVEAKIVTDKLRKYKKFGILVLYDIEFYGYGESNYGYALRDFSIKNTYFDKQYLLNDDDTDLYTFKQECEAVILAEIKEIFPESLHGLVKFFEKGIIINVVTKNVDSDHVEFTITMSNNEVISHTIDIRECNRICFDIILEKVKTAMFISVTTPSTSSSSIIIKLQPRESVPQHPNIFFDSLHPDFEGICEIKNFNPLITTPKNDNGVWKLLGDKLEAHIFINAAHHDNDWVKISVEFQKRYDPTKVYMFISKDADCGLAMSFYRYMLSTLAKFSN